MAAHHHVCIDPSCMYDSDHLCHDPYCEGMPPPAAPQHTAESHTSANARPRRRWWRRLWPDPAD